MIMDIFVIPIGQWFYGTEYSFAFDTRYGDMAKVDIVRIHGKEYTYTVDKSQCVIKEFND